MEPRHSTSVNRARLTRSMRRDVDFDAWEIGMAGEPVVHIGENSPEEVAFKLMQMIANVENKLLYYVDNPSGSNKSVANRKWILDTYAECKQAVREYRPKPQST